MLQACRPMGRLFYWALVTVVMASSVGAWAQSGPALTTVEDTVYEADGSAAQGTLVITWPAFVTASGAAIAPGTVNATLGANGALSVQLVPNAAATPAGIYYVVVYQLGPGEVRTEYWVVPTSSPATLAQVRATPGTGTAAQPVSMEYVNTALAGKADDSAVIHLAGAETVTGTKTFVAPPSVPAPVGTGDVANKGYVDTSISNVGAGTFLPTAGGTMTGPVTLSGNPTAPLQAAPKQYVDLAGSGKADLVSGLVPRSELGTGVASGLNCLLGNGTWGACGSSANATEIQSVPVGTTAPSDGQVLAYSAAAGQYAPTTAAGGAGGLSMNPASNQNIAQPGGTQFSANNLANIRYVMPSWNWAYTDNGGSLGNLATAGTGLTITLTCTTANPCPLGIDAAGTLAGHYPINIHYYVYAVYISGTGTPEAAPVTGGSCTPGATSGSCQLTVTTANNHPNGYTVGSASSGMQEAWNDAWIADSGTTANTTTAPYVKLAADTMYNVYSAVYLRGRGGVLEAQGAELNCFTRDRCIYVGTTQGAPAVNYHKLYNLSMISGVNVDGVQVASVSATAGTYTVTTASAHPFVAGDTVDCEYYATGATQHWAGVVLAAGLNATHFEVSFGNTTFAAGTTFGFCGLLNAAIEDNSDHVVMQDINIYYGATASNVFSFGIVNDNDQALVIEGAANRSDISIRSDANFPMGAFVYERNDQGNNGITYIHDAELTNVNCATGAGNGLVMTDSVCQGFPAYGVRYFGGLQPATFENVYQESTGTTSNPLYGAGSAQAGLVVQGGVGTKILGTFPLGGYSPVFATGGLAAAERAYFVVPRSSTLGYGPVLFIGSADPASGSVNIPLAWPSVELQSVTGQSVGTLTWDILETTGTAAVAPFSTGAFAIATNVSGACGTNGMCSFTDTQAAATTYTVAGQQYTPAFWFWPVSLAINGTTVFADEIGTSVSAVASQGTMGVSIVAEQCQPAGVSQQRSPIWITCLASANNGGAGTIATVLQEQDNANNGPVTNSKGRLNLGKAIGNVPNDLVTLQDSNFAKTVATAGERPGNDAGDMALGVDQAGGLTERAGTAISSYIGAIPTGANFVERVTAAAKTFNVPVTVNGNLTVTGTCAGCGGGGAGTVNGGTATQLAMYAANGTAVSGDSGLTDNGSTLNYAGSNGIAAAAGTFSGNVTVNGQLMVAGPWMVNSPVAGAAMVAAGAGTSSLGISNDGNFYISANAGAPQQVATMGTSSYFSNLFQEDGSDVGQYGATAQNLHVYSIYTNSSTWQRTSLGYDAGDNYAVLRSESSSSGAAPGLGLWINNGLKWVVDATGNLKPWTDQAYTVGSFNGAGSGSGFRPGTVYVSGNAASGSGFELGKYASESYELCNDTTNGTVVNGLAVLTTAGCAAKPGSALSSGAIGVVIANAGTSGVATLARAGSAYCSFDGSATVVGDYVVPSGTANGSFYPLCHDAGATRPTGAQILGRVLQASAGSTTVQMFLDMPGSNVSSSAGYAIPWFTTNTTGTAISFSSTANKAELWGAVLTFPLSTTQVTYYVSTADNTSNTYDVGVLNSAGSVVAHIGTTAGTAFAGSTGWKTLNWTAGATLQPGKYYLAITSSCMSSCAQIYGGTSAGFSFVGGTSGTPESVTLGGALNSGITIPADNPTQAAIMAWEIH